ncbi:MAG: ABC transporter substrate-binding protein [Oscillospiraceae bacterium]|nr:ABC transporter substrate-binding protein [Oscillospiraceae bacterium]
MIKKIMSVLLAAALLLSLAACSAGDPGNGGAQGDQSQSEQSQSGQPQAEPSQSEQPRNETPQSEPPQAEPAQEPVSEAPEWSSLSPERTMETEYAEQFTVDYYQGGYKLISTGDGSRYLVVPQGAQVPSGLDGSVRIIKQPLKMIYLAATSAMALFDSLDALDVIGLVGTKAEGWYVENAAAAINAGKMVFVGKYSEPDYEALLEYGCDLAIESTMILHTPKVQEMIEDIGIPVFIDRSSYESHPLGRTEWIKLYGAMVDKEEQAEQFFRSQAAQIEELAGQENSGKTVAFFSVSTSGKVNVRSSTDYVPKMIELAGGKYIFEDLTEEDSARSSLTITMEDFYATAVNADYLIYNSAIDNPLNSMDDLMSKSQLFADFKAVKEGNVWCTGKQLYQATDIVGNFITDIHRMLTGDTEGMTFIYKIN